MDINPETKVFGVTGFPLGHSLSPLMHNEAFRVKGINAVYLYFPSMSIRGVIDGMRGLSIQGLSVTIPHKETACAYVDELDPLASKIGALNTLFNRDGHIVGYNTDASGALDALKTVATDLRGKTVLIIGAGGAARAIGFAVVEEGCHVTVANRSDRRGEALARDLNAAFCPLKELNSISSDIIIQTTPVGMYPKVDDSVVPEGVLSEGMIVMDVVYNPLETRLIRTARTRGCKTVTGVEMFVRQGAIQFKLWTGQDAPFDRMMEIVKKQLLHG